MVVDRREVVAVLWLRSMQSPGLPRRPFADELQARVSVACLILRVVQAPACEILPDVAEHPLADPGRAQSSKQVRKGHVQYARAFSEVDCAHLDRPDERRNRRSF